MNSDSRRPCLLEVTRLRDGDMGEVARVAARMRRTLGEVMGPEGRALYPSDWLIDRVRFHLNRERSLGAIWLIGPARRHSVGHIIARIEPTEEGPLGLVSTIYVSPPWRRRRAANMLLASAEAWLVAKGAVQLATDTAQANTPLIHLMEGLGYQIVFSSAEKRMVRLARTVA